MEWLGLSGGMDVADSALAPDGSLWALTRSRGWAGIAQSVVPLIRSGAGYRLGSQWALPKLAFDNFEGMTIAARPGGGWRFWLVSDDGHRFGARTLLVALDLVPAPNANARRNSPGAVEPNSAGR